MNNPNIILTTNANLKKMNTYKLDCTVKYLVEVLNIEGLISTLKYIKEHNLKYFILGAGSNVILDPYFDGVVIKLSNLNNLTINTNLVTAEAGLMMNKLAQKSVESSLTGLEWATNIPGTIGGSINNNAGAYNSCIFDTLISITVLTPTLEIKTISKEEITYSYRHTNIKELGYIVLSATFKLTKGDKAESLTLIKDRCKRRLETQPLDMPSAGSVFRNPENDHAGRLIEAANLKGKTIGGAQISPKHANFIVNTGTATSQDIKDLIKLIQREIKTQFNIDLILEQEIVEWK